MATGTAKQYKRRNEKVLLCHIKFNLVVFATKIANLVKRQHEYACIRFFITTSSTIQLQVVGFPDRRMGALRAGAF